MAQRTNHGRRNLTFGGDKGGGTFKMSQQIANVAHPNSINNTLVFACFEAHDSVTNLHVALDVYTDQVEALMALTWQKVPQ